MSYTTYDSAMMAISVRRSDTSSILAFLGLGLSIRSARGVINGDRWYQARLVRFFWVWVAISAVVSTLITTTINEGSLNNRSSVTLRGRRGTVVKRVLRGSYDRRDMQEQE